MPEPLLVDEHEDRVVLRLNRPEVRNAIDRATVEALHAACAALEQAPRIALIAGSGGVFASGADIGELRERRRTDALAGINSGLFDRIARLPMPVIALIDGYALGGGAELAYACDFRLGTPTVTLGHPETNLGIMAAAGATWRLASLVGEPLAKEMLLAGRMLSADEAKRAGLLTDVVPADELEACGHRLADRIAARAPLAVRLTKRVFHAPRDAHPLVDDVAQAVLFETQDKQDRMTAFLERRQGEQ